MAASTLETAIRNTALAMKLAEVGRIMAIAGDADTSPHDEAMETVAKRFEDLQAHGAPPADVDAFVKKGLKRHHDRLAGHVEKWRLIMEKDPLAVVLYPNEAAMTREQAWGRLRSAQLYLDALDKVMEKK